MWNSPVDRIRSSGVRRPLSSPARPMNGLTVEPGGPPLCGDHDATARRCELDRVRQQVPDDLLQAIGIGDGLDGVGQMYVERQPLCSSGRTRRIQRAVDHGTQVHRPQVET